jgi:DNA-binding HxlR family transcriptional regulator
MRYDKRIDDVILKLLCTRQKCSYLKLKRKVDNVFSQERLNRSLKASISFETFNSHLKSLVSRNKVKREEEGPERSSRVNYSITSEVNCFEYKGKRWIDVFIE